MSWDLEAPMRVSGHAQLGDNLFFFPESRTWPAPTPAEEDPQIIELREEIRGLRAQIAQLEQRVADLEARRFSARWRRWLSRARWEWQIFLQGVGLGGS